MSRRRAERLVYLLGVAAFALAMVAGASRAIVTAHRLPGIAMLDSMSEARSGEELGEGPRALREYRVASRLALGDQRVFDEYVAAIARSGDRAELLDARLRERAQWPQSPSAHSDLGYALLANQRPDEALASFAFALRLNPTLWVAHAGRGDALRAQGRTGEAIEAYQTALRLAPRQAGLHEKLGVAYALAGKRDAAEQQFTQALRIDPNTPGVAEELEKLHDAGPESR